MCTGDGSIITWITVSTFLFSDDFRWKAKYFLLASIFKSLRFLSSGHAVPLPSRSQCFTGDSPSPHEIFYHLYKPNTPYRKTAPPQPDFSIVVVKWARFILHFLNENNIVFLPVHVQHRCPRSQSLRTCMNACPPFHRLFLVIAKRPLRQVLPRPSRHLLEQFRRPNHLS